MKLEKIRRFFISLSTSDWIQILSISLGTIILVIGWFTNSWLTSVRDEANRQHAMNVAYRIEAYENLALSSNRELTPEYAKMIETAIAKIQLLGTPEEIKAVDLFIENWKKPQPDGRPRADMDQLLFLLRNSLRKELSLPQINDPILWIRPLGGFPPSRE